MRYQRQQDRDYRKLLGLGLGLSLVLHGLVLALGHISVPGLGAEDASTIAEISQEPGTWRVPALEVVQLPASTRSSDAAPAQGGSEAASSAEVTFAGLAATPRVRTPYGVGRSLTQPVAGADSWLPTVELERRRPTGLHAGVTFTAASRAAREADGRGGAGRRPGTDYGFPGDPDRRGGITIGVSGGGGGCTVPVIGTIGGGLY